MRGERDHRGSKGKDHQIIGIKDTWIKPKGVGSRVEVGTVEVGRHGGVKMETTVLEQQFKKI